MYQQQFCFSLYFFGCHITFEWYHFQSGYDPAKKLGKNDWLIRFEERWSSSLILAVWIIQNKSLIFKSVWWDPEEILQPPSWILLPKCAISQRMFNREVISFTIHGSTIWFNICLLKRWPIIPCDSIKLLGQVH